MQTAKDKIKICFDEYVRLFPQEFEAVREQIAEERNANKDKFATFSKDSATVITRKLGEVPENLHNAIQKLLTKEEKDWLYAQGAFFKDMTGPYWFYTKYSVFAVTVV